jgi:hypothetical protein
MTKKRQIADTYQGRYPGLHLLIKTFPCLHTVDDADKYIDEK